MKKYFLNFATAFFAFALFLILIDPSKTLISKLGYTLMVISLFWYRQTMLWDWQFILEQQQVDSWHWASLVQQNNYVWQKTLIVSTSDGDVTIDTSKAHGITQYWGRWTIYQEEFGVKLLRDNSKLRNCWYYII